VIAEPPSSVILPPEIAVKPVTTLIGVVDRVAKLIGLLDVYVILSIVFKGI
jgi:hypothetical protein